MRQEAVSVVVPTLNEEGNVVELVERVDRALRGSGRAYEIIFIDDHSTDRTRELISELSQEYPVFLFLKEGKRGKAQSLIEGFEHANHPVVAILDADLQYPPEALPEMADKLHEGCDIVVANRLTQDVGWARRFLTWGFHLFFTRFLHSLDCDTQSGMKVFRRRITREVRLESVSPWTFDLEFLLKARNYGYVIGSHDIIFSERHAGRSKINVFEAIFEIGWNALKMRFRRRAPLLIHPETESHMIGAGIAHNRSRFITHTTLPPETSAVHTFVLWQRVLVFLLVAALAAGLWFAPLATGIAFVAVMTLIYFIDTVFNLVVSFRSMSRPPELAYDEADLQGIREENLPVYSVLCPLYKEAHMLPGFVRAMDALDWPKDKLDVLLLLEENDGETIAAARAMDLPDHIRIVVVPHSFPKTKPKACNYGLSVARGEYLVIYDAEDVPEPEQLKKAYLGFTRLPDHIWCLQAKLNYFNPYQNLLTRLFTAEYSLWFDVVLPGLQSIETAIPLGGTSNHFRRRDLLQLEGWDPFNVTEDCDLGVRMFSRGYRTAIIDSVTLEEANSNLKNWLRQRSRWIKGYMQTYLVHMRHPLRLFRKNGWHALLFQLIVGGKIAFMLVNPLLWTMTIGYFVFRDEIGLYIEALYPTIVFYMAVVSLIFGNFLYMYYYMVGTAKRGHWPLVKYSLFVPFLYWPIVSVAAFIALWQLFTKPHYWEKTHHGLHLNLPEKKRRFLDVRPAGESVALPAPVMVASVSDPSMNSYDRALVEDESAVGRIVSMSEEPAPAKAESAFRREALARLFGKRKAEASAAITAEAVSVPVVSVSETAVTMPAEAAPAPMAETAIPLPDDELLNGEAEATTPTGWFGTLARETRVLLRFVFSREGFFMFALLFSAFLNFLFNAYLGRRLPLEDFALITLVNTLWYFSMIFLSPFSSAVNHETAYAAKADLRRIGGWVERLVRRSVGAMVYLSIGWLVLVPWLATFFQVSPLVLYLFTPVFTLGVFSTTHRGFLQGRLRFVSAGMIFIFEAAAKLVLAAAFLESGYHQLTYLAIPLSIAFSALSAWAFARPVLREAKEEPSDLSRPFPIKFYLASFVGGLATLAFLNIDLLLVKHFLPSREAGEYALLSVVGKMVFFLGSIPSSLIITLVSRAEGLNRNSRIVFRRLYAMTALVTVGGAGILGFYGGTIIPWLFGDRAVVVVPHLFWYAMAMALITLTNVVSSYHASRKQYLYALVPFVSVTVMVVAIIAAHASLDVITWGVFIAAFSGWLMMHFLDYHEKYMLYFQRGLRDFADIFIGSLPSVVPAGSKHRILIFNWRDKRHIQAGGAEEYVHEIAREWVAQGHQVTMFAGNDGKSPREEQVDGVSIVRRGGFYFVYLWAPLYYLFRFRGKYDVVIDCQNGVPFFTPLFVREPVFCLMHHVHQIVFFRELPGPLAYFASWLERDLMPWMYRDVPFITVSESSREEMLELGLGRAGIEIVHPGVHMDRLLGERVEKSAVPLVLYLGRLKAYKSVDVLIKAFRQVSENLPEARLVIAGTGDEEESLQEFAASLGLSPEQVEFTGFVSEEEKRRLLQRAWVLVNPSFMEGWGIVSIEANACGTPVIASDVSGLRDSVAHDRSGFLVPYGDDWAFAERILQVLEDGRLREKMSRQAKEWAEQFTWKKSGRSFMAILENRNA